MGNAEYMGSGELSSQSPTPLVSLSPHHTPHTTLSHTAMAIPDSVKAKVGEMPDVSSMSKEDLAALVKQMYDQSCAVFGEKFDMEYQVKKMDMEIYNLEMETSESHGTFKIPKLKKVNKFKMMGDEEEGK